MSTAIVPSLYAFFRVMRTSTLRYRCLYPERARAWPCRRWKQSSARSGGGRRAGRRHRRPCLRTGRRETAFPWRKSIHEALAKWPTPFYINAWLPVREAVEQLALLSSLGVPVRHWLSVKTQPVKPLLMTWRRTRVWRRSHQSLELHAVREAGFRGATSCSTAWPSTPGSPSDLTGLRVHLDSPTEAQTIGPERLREHRLGARCHVESGHNPGDPTIGGQFEQCFSLPSCEGARLLAPPRACARGPALHLRSSIVDAETYASALERTLAMGEAAGVAPTYVDCGGGFPSPGEAIWDGDRWVPDQLPLSESVGETRAIGQSRCVVAGGQPQRSGPSIAPCTFVSPAPRGGLRRAALEPGAGSTAPWSTHALAPAATLPPRLPRGRALRPRPRHREP